LAGGGGGSDSDHLKSVDEREAQLVVKVKRTIGRVGREFERFLPGGGAGALAGAYYGKDEDGASQLVASLGSLNALVERREKLREELLGGIVSIGLGGGQGQGKIQYKKEDGSANSLGVRPFLQGGRVCYVRESREGRRGRERDGRRRRLLMDDDEGLGKEAEREEGDVEDYDGAGEDGAGVVGGFGGDEEDLEWGWGIIITTRPNPDDNHDLLVEVLVRCALVESPAAGGSEEEKDEDWRLEPTLHKPSNWTTATATAAATATAVEAPATANTTFKVLTVSLAAVKTLSAVRVNMPQAGSLKIRKKRKNLGKNLTEVVRRFGVGPNAAAMAAGEKDKEKDKDKEKEKDREGEKEGGGVPLLDPVFDLKVHGAEGIMKEIEEVKEGIMKHPLERLLTASGPDEEEAERRRMWLERR